MRCTPPTSAVTWCVAFPIDSLDGARGGAGQCALRRLAGVGCGESKTYLHIQTRAELCLPPSPTSSLRTPVPPAKPRRDVHRVLSCCAHTYAIGWPCGVTG